MSKRLHRASCRPRYGFYRGHVALRREGRGGNHGFRGRFPPSRRFTRTDSPGLLREPVDDDNDGRRAQEAERDEEAVPAGARMVDAVICARALARRRARGPSRAFSLESSNAENGCLDRQNFTAAGKLAKKVTDAGLSMLGPSLIASLG